MTRMFRRLMAGLALGLALGAATGGALAAVEVTDLAGRRVAVPDTVERVLLGEGRFLPTLAILEGRALPERIVGMMGEFERLDPDGYAAWAARFPALDKVPRIGRASGGSFSVEQAIALRPQVAIFGLEGHGPAPRDRETIARLQAAGTAIVFIDLRQDPVVNTPKSVELLGRVLGRQAQATEFVRYWDAQMRRVAERLQARRPAPPAVFLESRVGLAEGCCETMVGMMGKLLIAAGGRNIASGRVPGEHGTLNPEFLIAAQPDVYIGTAVGIASAAGKTPTRIALGAGATPDSARASLARALERRATAQLRAVRQGRAYAVWHHFYNSPFNVAAVQAMAKWLHPGLFQDLDPGATLAEMHARFQPIPLTGVYWVALQ